MKDALSRFHLYGYRVFIKNRVEEIQHAHGIHMYPSVIEHQELSVHLPHYDHYCTAAAANAHRNRLGHAVSRGHGCRHGRL